MPPPTGLNVADAGGTGGAMGTEISTENKRVCDVFNSLSDLGNPREVFVSVSTGYALTLTLSLREREFVTHPLCSRCPLW